MFNSGKEWRPGWICFRRKHLHSFYPVIVQVAHINSISVPVEHETFVRNRRAFFETLDSLREAASFEAAFGRGAARDGSDLGAANFLPAAFAQFDWYVAGSID